MAANKPRRSTGVRGNFCVSVLRHLDIMVHRASQVRDKKKCNELGDVPLMREPLYRGVWAEYLFRCQATVAKNNASVASL